MLRADKNKKLHVGFCKHFHICVPPLQPHYLCMGANLEYTSKYTKSTNGISNKCSFPLISSSSGNRCCFLE